MATASVELWAPLLLLLASVHVALASRLRVPGLEPEYLHRPCSNLAISRGLDADNSSQAAFQARWSCLKRDAAPEGPREALTFIHIPRNAGTSIETCSLQDPNLPASQRWGVANGNIHGLYKMPMLHQHPGYDKPWGPSCYKQHVPPQFLPDIYADKETFCVVRDPYSRMVSQFLFLMIHFRKKQEECTAGLMNQKLLEHLTMARKENPYIGDCHYLPQTTFVFGIDPDTAAPVFKDEEKRSCKHVLHLENLSSEFEALMNSHGYPYQLRKHEKAGGTLGPEDCSYLRKEHLSPEVRSLIEEIFAEDFKRLGYKHL